MYQAKPQKPNGKRCKRSLFAYLLSMIHVDFWKGNELVISLYLSIYIFPSLPGQSLSNTKDFYSIRLLSLLRSANKIMWMENWVWLKSKRLSLLSQNWFPFGYDFGRLYIIFVVVVLFLSAYGLWMQMQQNKAKIQPPAIISSATKPTTLWISEIIEIAFVHIKTVSKLVYHTLLTSSDDRIPISAR